MAKFCWIPINDIKLKNAGNLQLVYSYLTKNIDKQFINLRVCTSSHQKTYSDNSYAFSNDNKCNTLKEIFKIKDDSLFCKAFEEAACGEGGEYKNITKLHASSMFALLCFFNIKNCPLKIKINKNGEVSENIEDEIEFNNSIFEWENPVIKGRGNSSIDIVLIGKRIRSRTPVILFLESKFAEYIYSKNKCISIDYLNNKITKSIYDALKKKGYKININDDKKEFEFIPNNPLCYSEGIKQMISHYLGLYNYLVRDKGINSCNSETKKSLIKDIINSEVFLASSVFDFKIAGYLNAYSKKYEELSSLLNSFKINGRTAPFKVIKSLLTHQNIFKNYPFKDMSRIKAFYKFDR